MDAGHEILVTTSFTSMDEVPDKLRKVFELKLHRNSEWLDLPTGVFAVGATAPVGLNLNALYVLGSATAAAVAGGMIGGPAGAGVGGLLGAGAGAIAAAMAEGGQSVEVIITADGKLTIRVKPAKA